MKGALGVILLIAAAAPSSVHADPSAYRAMRAGADMGVGQEITTGPRQRALLSFPDGAVLAVGPQSQVALDRLVYAEQSGSGDLIVSVRRGVCRFTGGTTSRTMPSVIATPSSTLTVRDGTAIVSVTAESTVAILVDGAEMKVVANGRTEIVSQPGWEATTLAGSAPGAPVPMPYGVLRTETARLEALTEGRSVDQAVVGTQQRPREQ